MKRVMKRTAEEDAKGTAAKRNRIGRAFWLCAVLAVLESAACLHVQDIYAGEENYYLDDPVISDTEFIQQIVDATPTGGDCVIPKGDYTIAGVSLSRPIHLQGGGKVILRPQNRKAAGNTDPDKLRDRNFVFAIWSDDVSIEGFTFESGAVPHTVDIAHYYGNRPVIRNNTFITGQEGIRIMSAADSDQCLIENNRFTTAENAKSLSMIRLGYGGQNTVIRNNTINGESFSQQGAVLAFASKEPSGQPGEAVFVSAAKRSTDGNPNNNPSTSDFGSGLIFLPLFFAGQIFLVIKLRKAKKRRDSY